MRVQIKARNQGFQLDAESDETILYAALRAGIALPYECATGTCGTCRAKLLDGRVRDAWPEAPGRRVCKDAEYLLCQCTAETDLTVELRGFVGEPGPFAPGYFDGRLRAPKLLTHDVMSFTVELDVACDFDAGQFMAVSAPGVSGMRGYSMVNYARGSRTLDFVTKRKPGGGFSEWLFAAAPEGSALRLFGPLGKATYHPELSRNIVCIAGGSGIAGMISILHRAVHDRGLEQHQGWLFFGVRSSRDLFYLKELSELCTRSLGHLKVTIALSDESVPETLRVEWPTLSFAQGFVHEVAKRVMAGQYQNVRAYLAGPPPAVTAALRLLLLEAKLTADNIRYDKFT